MSVRRLEKINTHGVEWTSLLKDLLQKLNSAGPICKVYIFGSFAAGTMSQASDLDIAVILPNNSNPEEFKRKLPRPLCSWPLDLLIVNNARFEERKNFGGVLMEVFHHGVELYPNWVWRNE